MLFGNPLLEDLRHLLGSMQILEREIEKLLKTLQFNTSSKRLFLLRLMGLFIKYQYRLLDIHHVRIRISMAVNSQSGQLSRSSVFSKQSHVGWASGSKPSGNDFCKSRSS